MNEVHAVETELRKNLRKQIIFNTHSWSEGEIHCQNHQLLCSKKICSYVYEIIWAYNTGFRKRGLFKQKKS